MPRAFLSSLVFLAIVAIAFTFSGVDYSWEDWHPASCMPDNCFCEAIRDGAVRQPANTWSSFGFVLVGIWVLNHGSDTSRLLSQKNDSVFDWLYGLAAIAIGLGSAFYHTSLSFAGQFCDLLGMYLLAVLILLHHLSRVTPMSDSRLVSIYFAAILTLSFLLIAAPALRRYLFAALVLTIIVIAYRSPSLAHSQQQRRYFTAAVLALLVAFVCWTVDLTRVLCEPTSWLQGHALWHLLGALAVGLLHASYRMPNTSNWA